MRQALFATALLLATFTLPTTTRAQQDVLPIIGVAPELHNNVFLNTEAPIRLADLRGQVVLLKFWTYDCINCIRTLPHIQRWYETYADQGFAVIGDHYPEFSYERDLGNLEAAVARLGVTFPVAQDNNRRTWAAYDQRFWPTILFIDKAGNIRYRHIGEGRYNTTEAAIQQLLAEPYTPEVLEETATTATDAEVTPRLYLSPTEPLNVRRGPGTNFQRLGTLSVNTVLVVLGEQDGWYEIEYDGEAGRYVSGEYVQLGEW